MKIKICKGFTGLFIFTLLLQLVIGFTNLNLTYRSTNKLQISPYSSSVSYLLSPAEEIEEEADYGLFKLTDLYTPFLNILSKAAFFSLAIQSKPDSSGICFYKVLPSYTGIFKI